MRLLFVIFLFVMASCEEPADDDTFYPLSEDQKRLLPDTYLEGDTLTFLYTDSQNMDTQYYVIGKQISHVTSYTIPKYGNQGSFETLELPIVALGNYSDLTLALGNKSNNRHGGVHFWIGYGIIPLGEMKEEPVDRIYQVRNSYTWWETDSVFLTYSPYDGIKLFEGFERPFRLERLP